MTTSSNELLNDPADNIFSTPDQWQAIFGHVISENQKILSDAMTQEGYSLPKMPVDLAIFDPDVVSATFTEILKKLSENPEQLIDLHYQQVEHVQNVWHTILTQSVSPTEEIADTKIERGRIDRRFKDPLWSKNPLFSALQQIYLMNAQFLKDAVANIKGIDSKTQHKLNFYTQHLVDALSPTNFPFTNPQVIRETLETRGENLIQGFKNYLRDTVDGTIKMRITDEDAFQVGENLAITPGKVIFQNDLFQLIQYQPTTEQVMTVPLLIIPPWINKYYIFDLRQENSFVKWAVDSGITVFVMSWVNPDERHAQKSFSDYVLEGARTAVDKVCEVTQSSVLNTIGYCSGGILLNSLMSYMAAKKDQRIQSATIMAAPTDFKEAGDLLVYICEQQLQKLEEYAQRKGYIDGQAIVKSFNLLRANDLIWSSYINNYLLGQEVFPFDMLHWNCDALRMPATMHIDFLRRLFLENRLIQPGGIRVDSVKIDLTKIKVPIFLMAAIDDHIAPWRAVYPLTQYASNVQKFVLGASGHVAGVLNHPSRNKYHYWRGKDFSPKADNWLSHAEKIPGSWWPEWRQWLEGFSGGAVPSRAIPKEQVLEDAPGSYVLVVGD